jgi:hypothetical protein
MKPWLRGDLSGVDPRTEMGLLRDAVLGGAHRGEDLRRFWAALGKLDPVACAELAAGPRAVPHRVAVEGALTVVDVLEQVVAPSGLYFRLADLAPEAGPTILETAARRHPAADWVVRLSRKYDPTPGQIHLQVNAKGARFADACGACARGGLVQALGAVGEETGSPLPAVSLCRARRIEACVEVAARTLDTHPAAPVVQWLAAVYGPEMVGLVSRIAARLSNPAAVERVTRLTALIA